MRNLLAGLLVLGSIGLVTLSTRPVTKTVRHKCIVEHPYHHTLQHVHFLIAMDGTSTEVSLDDYYLVKLYQPFAARHWIARPNLMQPEGEFLCIAE